MKRRIILLAISLLLSGSFFVSCDKSEDEIITDTNDNNIDKFVGVYDYTAVYDSISMGDGEWYSIGFYEEMTGDTYEPDNGYLTITEENGRYHLVCTLVYSDTGEEVTYFDTWATNNNGILSIESTSTTFETGVVFDFSFSNFVNNMPQIKFKSVINIDFISQGFAYLLNYSCTKR